VEYIIDMRIVCQAPVFCGKGNPFILTAINE